MCGVGCGSGLTTSNATAMLSQCASSSSYVVLSVRFGTVAHQMSQGAVRS